VSLAPRARRFVLTTHVVSSVGWLGALVAYVALDLTAVLGTEPRMVQAAYLGMELLVRSVIVPLALLSVVVGVVNALATPWGLFRHYWVLVKLVLTVLATAVLLLEAPTVAALARSAVGTGDPRALPGSLPHSVGGLVVLLVTTTLSVYKPRGLTRYGWRKQHRRASDGLGTSS
jgi:hypothetical protein